MRLPLYGFWNGLCTPSGCSVSFAGQKAYLNDISAAFQFKNVRKNGIKRHFGLRFHSLVHQHSMTGRTKGDVALICNIWCKKLRLGALGRVFWHCGIPTILAKSVISLDLLRATCGDSVNRSDFLQNEARGNRPAAHAPAAPSLQAALYAPGAPNLQKANS